MEEMKTDYGNIEKTYNPIRQTTGWTQPKQHSLAHREKSRHDNVTMARRCNDGLDISCFGVMMDWISVVSEKSRDGLVDVKVG